MRLELHFIYVSTHKCLSEQWILLCLYYTFFILWNFIRVNNERCTYTPHISLFQLLPYRLNMSPSKPHIFHAIFFFDSPLRSINAAYTCTHVRPSTGVWGTYQWNSLKKRIIFSPSSDNLSIYPSLKDGMEENLPHLYQNFDWLDSHEMLRICHFPFRVENSVTYSQIVKKNYLSLC